jgi:hypothetical protein
LCCTAQVPPVLDEQQLAVEQDEQVAPPCPHEPPLIDPEASHVPALPPLQHPSGQVFESHEQVPLVLSQRPLAHPAQVAPPVPHCEEVSDA